MFSKRKVLVVDDNWLMSWSLGRALRGEGYEVSVSHNGEEALKEIEEHDFDMVISDLKMEGKNGLDVLEQVRRLCPSATSVLMTAFGSEKIAQEAEKKGAYYIEKPIKIDEFKVNVDQMFTH